jgi:hypothetical protein
MLDFKKIGEMIDVFKSMTSNQIALIVVVVPLCVGAVLWVENRYAKISEIEKEFAIRQQQLESSYFLAVELLMTLPEQQRKLIMEKLELSKKTKEKSL